MKSGSIRNLSKKVVDHFSFTSEVYSGRKGFVHEEDPIILEFIRRTYNSNLKILEVGGGQWIHA